MKNRTFHFSDFLVRPESSIREALQIIDKCCVSNVFVADRENRLIGTVAERDIRRAILKGMGLEASVRLLVTKPAATVDGAIGRAGALDLMRALKLHEVPIVDSDGTIVGMHVEEDVMGLARCDNWAVIMAGGRGTRLAPLTNDIPKPMLPVAGRPILERLVLHLVGSGVRTIFISVNYLADAIEKHFGDGTQFGCTIEYLREDSDRPLGTGGALRLLGDLGYHPDKPVLVMNGDLITEFPVEQMLSTHESRDAVATIAVSEYRHQVPFGVLAFTNDRLVEVVEKPTSCWAVNAGIYALEPRLFDLIPKGEMFPITRLFDECLSRSWPVGIWRIGDWLDIGRPAELALARGEVT